MIDWENSQRLNDMTVNELKEYFDKRPGSHKKVYKICDECGEIKVVSYKEYRSLCKKCQMKSPETRQKMSDNHYDCSGKNNPNYGKTGELSPIYGDKNIMYEKHHTKETKEKCRIAATGRIQSEEEKEKRRKSNILACTPEVRKKISKSLSGLNHYNWKGGISFGEYCSKFNNQLKQSIRDKYDNCDYISGIHKSICNSNRKLDVHHVDYNKQQGCNNHDWKLVPLSKSNHVKTNFNRSFWNKLFTYSLKIDKEYYTDNKINIWEMIK